MELVTTIPGTLCKSFPAVRAFVTLPCPVRLVPMFLTLTLMSSFTCLSAITKIIIANTWTPEMIVVVITGGLGAISTAVIAIQTARTNNRIREAQELAKIQRKEDSEERKAVAAAVKDEVVKAAAKVEEAHKDIQNRIQENTAVNVKAIEVANGHNEKIVTLTEMMPTMTAVAAAAAASAIKDAPPQRVEVVNTPQHPVPVFDEAKQ